MVADPGIVWFSSIRGGDSETAPVGSLRRHPENTTRTAAAMTAILAT
jgi:hypothetical protein